jgi:hypothetical protein
MNLTALLLGILGAAAWLAPLVYEQLQRAEPHGRIVGWFIQPEVTYSGTDLLHNKEEYSVSGAMYCLRLSLVSLRRDLVIKACSIHVRFPNDPVRHPGAMIFGRGAFVVLDGKRKFIHVPPEQNLATSAVLERDKVNTRYALFIVPATLQRDPYSFETVEITFWGAPGLMDSHDGECTMKPEVSIGYCGEEAAEVLYA